MGGVDEMPKTSAHILLTFTSLATILKLLGTPYKDILLTVAPSLLVDPFIDAGHTDSGRSIATHSIITAPILGLLACILTVIFLSFLEPLIKPLGLGLKLVETYGLYGCLYASLLHLLLDSLTWQGIHVPLVGWVSLADLESQGAVANLIPVSLSIALIYFFWMGGKPWTPI
jgi:hypothetical protein